MPKARYDVDPLYYGLILEPAIRIERTTCGLRNRNRGVAQVLDDWAIPSSRHADGADGESVLFVPSQFISSTFAALLNTVITPPPSSAHTGAGWVLGPI